MDTRREKLEALKKEKNAVIMAHYYVPDEVQEIALQSKLKIRKSCGNKGRLKEIW